MFPGQGAESTEMAGELYRDEPAFRGHLDECADLLAADGIDLRAALRLPGAAAPGSARPTPQAADLTARPLLAQVALLSFEYGLARTLLGWGLEPAAVIGHSLGEYAAATIAGALSLADALRLVAARGRLAEGLDPGGMLAVALPEAELLPQLGGALSLAAVNAPDACVVAGPRAPLRQLAARLGRSGTAIRWLPVTRPFHSAAMDSVLASFETFAVAATLCPARRAWMSTLTGDWMTGGTEDRKSVV